MLKAIYARRSIRQYTDEPVSEGDIQELLKAAMAAPSANNLKPWHFCVVTDRTKLDALAEVLPYGKMLYKAPLALVVCGDPSVAPKYWVQDCSVATENISAQFRSGVMTQSTEKTPQAIQQQYPESTPGNAVAVIGLVLTMAAMLFCGVLFGSAEQLAEHEEERENRTARQLPAASDDVTPEQSDTAGSERSSEQLRVLLLASVAAVLNLVGLILCITGLLIPNRPRAAAIGGTVISALLFVGVFGMFELAILRVQLFHEGGGIEGLGIALGDLVTNQYADEEPAGQDGDGQDTEGQAETQGKGPS